ncbi:MAG: MAPEG family protein [Cyanobacteria bacterium P01_H01_bin.15]
MTIVPTYAALLGIIFVTLSIRIILLRQSLKILLGDKGNPRLLRAMRVHSNFAEYVPLCLILLGFAELQGTSPLVLNLLGLGLLIGRMLHAYGVSQAPENTRFRVAGMALTFICILSTSTRLIANALNAS